jgi:hypothetical protein
MEGKMRQIGYNNQRDNFIVAGIKGSSQCFATAAWMFMSFYTDKYEARDDTGLKKYIADLTANDAQHEYEWEAQRNEIQKYLNDAGIKGKVKLGINLFTGVPLVSADALKALLKQGPVIIGTSKMAGLPGGHLILGVDVTDNGSIICHDPYGNALTGYKDQNGEAVTYPISMFDAKYPTGPVRAIWFEVE